MTYTNRERVVDSIAPSLLAWLMDCHLAHEKSDEIKEIRDVFDLAVNKALYVKNPIRQRAIMKVYKIVIDNTVAYIRRTYPSTKKAMFVVVEWAYALHDARAIDIGECGYGNAINRIDDIIHQYLQRNDPDGKLERSIEKHVKKLHKHVSKFIVI